VDNEAALGATCWSLDALVSTKASLLEAQGRDADALTLLAGGWQAAELVPLAPAAIGLGPHLARCYVRAGERAAAFAVAQELGRLAGENPGISRLQAVAMWAGGLAAGDPAMLLEAVERYDAAPRPFERAQVCEDAAAVLARAGSPAEARAHLAKALDLYGQLGAVRCLASARTRLRSLGVGQGVRGSRRRPVSGWASLTGAELRVVQLVGGRLSNAEIAERLFVSRRTVESHVSHALSKLDCTSRQRLGEAARDHRDGEHRVTGEAHAVHHR